MNAIYDLNDLRDWENKRASISPPIRLGVLGDPVAHSLSPAMQNAALAGAGLAMQYARFQIAPNELEAAAPADVASWVSSVCNLTVPHKIAALALVDEVEERARKIGAINTIVFRDRQVVRLEHRRARFCPRHPGGVLRRPARSARAPARSGWGSRPRPGLPMRLRKLRAACPRQSHL